MECETSEVTQTWVNILLTIRRMVVDGIQAMRKSKKIKEGNSSKNSKRKDSEKYVKA